MSSLKKTQAYSDVSTFLKRTVFWRDLALLSKWGRELSVYLVMSSAVSWWEGWLSSWTFWLCCQTQKLWRVVAALKLTVGPSCLGWSHFGCNQETGCAYCSVANSSCHKYVLKFLVEMIYCILFLSIMTSGHDNIWLSLLEIHKHKEWHRQRSNNLSVPFFYNYLRSVQRT